MTYDLPESIELHGQIFPIVSDFRAILVIMEVLNDKELTDEARAVLALHLFYRNKGDAMPEKRIEEAYEYVRGLFPGELINEAYERLCWFIRGGEAEHKPGPVLMNWEKDFPLIIGPVNKALGTEARAEENLHWWTFLGAYMSLGECLFNQVVAIRKKRAEHKKLEKWEKDFVKQNPELVALDSRPQYTAAEQAFFNMFAR